MSSHTNVLASWNVFFNASTDASLREKEREPRELRRRPRMISIWIIRRQNVSTYVRRYYRHNKIGKGRYGVARVNGRQAEREREKSRPARRSTDGPAGQVLSDLRIRARGDAERGKKKKKKRNTKKEREREIEGGKKKREKMEGSRELLRTEVTCS